MGAESSVLWLVFLILAVTPFCQLIASWSLPWSSAVSGSNLSPARAHDEAQRPGGTSQGHTSVNPQPSFFFLASGRGTLTNSEPVSNGKMRKCLLYRRPHLKTMRSDSSQKSEISRASNFLPQEEGLLIRALDFSRSANNSESFLLCKKQRPESCLQLVLYKFT